MGIKWIWIAAAAAAAVAFSFAALRRKKNAGNSACGDGERNKPFSMKAAPSVTSPAPVCTNSCEPAHRGQVSVPGSESVPEGEVVRSPASAVSPAAENSVAAPAAEELGDERPVILVAEDNSSNYKLVEVLLRNDYRLVHAENGQEAVELYAMHRPSVVLMDISMPVMDGYDALKAIRASDPEARVVALTAYAFEADRQRMMQSGFDACLAKPLDVQELRRLIRSELDKARE